MMVDGGPIGAMLKIGHQPKRGRDPWALNQSRVMW